MLKPGRPKGSAIRLLDDPGRFEVAVWLALTERGMKPYQAAYLVTFLLASDRPITIESVEGALLKLSTIHRTTVIGHADRVRRKAPEAIKRADEDERAWLARSAGLVLPLIGFLAVCDTAGVAATLDMLAEQGWTETLLAISSRMDASLKSNFPPAEGPLSRAAVRILREMQQQPK